MRASFLTIALLGATLATAGSGLAVLEAGGMGGAALESTVHTAAGLAEGVAADAEAKAAMLAASGQAVAENALSVADVAGAGAAALAGGAYADAGGFVADCAADAPFGACVERPLALVPDEFHTTRAARDLAAAVAADGEAKWTLLREVAGAVVANGESIAAAATQAADAVAQMELQALQAAADHAVACADEPSGAPDCAQAAAAVLLQA